MSDRTTTGFADLDRAFNEVEALTLLLYTRAREDIAGAVLPGQSYEARVSGAGEMPLGDGDPETVPVTRVERAVLTDQLRGAHTYQAVVGKLRSVARQLLELHGDITPTGAPCGSAARDPANGQTVRCRRMAVRDGWCTKCWPHVHNGQPPDARLLRDWNSRLERDCQCTAAACPHQPGSCLNRIKPGVQGASCGTCRNRRSAADTAPFRWHDPT